ncbi:hypothetical protein Tco_0138103 [Tanacetum coccineum]
MLKMSTQRLSEIHSDDEASYHEDASDYGTATNKPKQQQQQLILTTTTISNIKLPILKKEEYDIWAMEMEHYLEYIDNDVWKVIHNGNSKKKISTRRRVRIDGNKPVGAGKKEQNQNCLLTIDDGVVNWGEHTVTQQEFASDNETKRSNSRTSNTNAVCAECGKCVFNSNHDACVSRYLKDVHARTKKPHVVPISASKPNRKANKSVATPHKKTVASDTTIQKSKSYYKKLYENTNQEWKWWIG